MGAPKGEQKMPLKTPAELAELKAIRGADYEPDEADDDGGGIPHLSNSGEAVASEIAGAESLTQAAREKLKRIIAGIEKVEEEQRDLAGVKRDKYGEAKAMGYDTKAIRRVVALRKIDRQEREEQQAILDTYLHAIGELEFYD